MGGHSVDLSFLLFHQLSHMKVKVAPVINDKKHPKHLVVTGALHVIQWIWGPQNHPSKSLLWMRQLKKCARLLTAVKQWVTLWTFPHWPTPLIMVFLHCPACRSNHLMEYWGTQVICHPFLNFLYSMSQGFLTKQLGLLTTTASFTITVFCGKICYIALKWYFH